MPSSFTTTTPRLPENASKASTTDRRRRSTACSCFLAQQVWYVKTSTTRDLTNSYHLPAIDVETSQTLHSVVIDVSDDPLAWNRNSTLRGGTLYQWVHESHPDLPYDDWIQLSTRNGIVSPYLSIVLSIAIPLFAFAWSKGLLAVGALVEGFIRYMVSTCHNVHDAQTVRSANTKKTSSYRHSNGTTRT